MEDLKRLVSALEEEGAANVKLTGEIVFVWDTPRHPPNLEHKTGMMSNTFRFAGVRPVKMCSAETFCERFVRPVLNLALEIDRRFRGEPLPAKLSIGVAGCARSCSEPATKDIGVTGHPDGYEIKVGGAAGLKPRIGVRLAVVPSEEDVLAVIGRIIAFARRNGGNHARLWKLIEETGFGEFSKMALDKV